MKKIFVIGAGRSAVILIKYLLDNSIDNNWKIIVADFSEDLAKKVVGKHPNGVAIYFDVTDDSQRFSMISDSDIIISMLPASMHISVAKDCIKLKKNLVTASYVSDEMGDLNEYAINSGVLLLNEMGLDPGIDHMSAMKVIDDIKMDGGKLISFKSYCGGLVHPNYDNNPWNYKFTWNPRNVVLAGQGTAQYIKNGKYKFIPYHKLFNRLDVVKVSGLGEFEGYPNRDSLSYRKKYGLENIPTMLRGTLRRQGYCKSWNIFVQLGMTDDSCIIENKYNMTYREFTNLFFPYDKVNSVEQKFCDYLSISIDSNEFKKIEWLGLFSDDRIKEKHVSPAKVLQSLLEKKWSLKPEDKDMIVMQHQFEFLKEGENNKLYSSLIVSGEDSVNTAMAKTVGLPVAIATKLILNGEIDSIGVQIPTNKNIYVPVLRELAKNGIKFSDKLI